MFEECNLCCVRRMRSCEINKNHPFHKIKGATHCSVIERTADTDRCTMLLE